MEGVGVIHELVSQTDVVLEAFDDTRDTVEGYGGAKPKPVTLAEEFVAIGSRQEYDTKFLEPGAEWT